ncbi:Catalase domain-containing protein [Mycena sanguinolenta]|uniref:Catalase domain-containing protein n=1 Tax=Mycena sanguinolenta TaxID=230812 RepID=A0A8H6YWX4_9AGAR|nr:Catalase domain-containing protein [Mycena sanguinolenta]
MSYATAYHGLPQVPGQDPTVVHTYGYLGTPAQERCQASDETVNILAPRRAVRPQSLIPPSRKKLWAPALTIVGSLVAGCLFAIGHHLYFSSLNGKNVQTTTVLSGLTVFDEKWANHVAVALAFLVKFSFSMCVGVAYVQTLWKTARRPLGLSVAGLDASFSLLSNPMKFLSTDLLFSAQFLLLLAAISWLVPIVSVFSPGALTVVQQLVNGTVPCVVPALNLGSSYAADNFGVYEAPLHLEEIPPGGAAYSLDGPKQALKRIATTTLLDGTYTAPISPCVANASVCSYSTSYVAPYFQCGDPVQSDYANNTNFATPTPGYTWFNATYFPSSSNTTGDQLVVGWKGSDDTVSVFTCTAMNATYAVDVQHTPNTHYVSVSSVVTNGVLNTENSDGGPLAFVNLPLSDPGNPDSVRSEIISAAVLQAVVGTIAGSVVSSNPLQTGHVTISTSDTLVGMSNFGVINEDTYVRNFTAAPDMAGLVTSLLQNVTIGLMATNAADAAVSTTCVQAVTETFYLYHPMTLWPPYAAAAAATLLAAAIGLSALWSNQSSVDTNFTAMIEVTRNSALDAVPGKDPARVRLRYGLVNDGGEERMAFGQLREFGEHPLAHKAA